MADQLDPIMMWVANDEGFYNSVMRLYDRWVEDGDSWDETSARKQAERVIRECAQALATGMRRTTKRLASA